jgi:hypothetical protein
VNLAAQDKALRADGRVIGKLSTRTADTGSKSIDLVAALTAEAASPLRHVVGDTVQRAKRSSVAWPERMTVSAISTHISQM